MQLEPDEAELDDREPLDGDEEDEEDEEGEDEYEKDGFIVDDVEEEDEEDVEEREDSDDERQKKKKRKKKEEYVLDEDDYELLEDNNISIQRPKGSKKFKRLKKARRDNLEPSGFSDDEDFVENSRGGRTAEEKLKRSLFGDDEAPLEDIAEVKQHAASGGRGGGMGMNIQDIFSQFFGGGGGMEEEEKIPKGDDVVVELDASLEDLYMGGSLKVWREKNIIKPAPGKRRCNCRNEVYHKQIGPGMFQQMTEQVCEQCPNVKFEREGYFVTVDIEKGMQDGQEVTFYEDGEPMIDGEAGDLRFRIHTAPHDVFRREGNDLHTTITITLVQALVGFEKSLKHLDEHLVEIGTKGITKPKEVRKFKGEGMPLHFSTKKGDLYVTYEVLFPTSLTEDQKTSIQKILG